MTVRIIPESINIHFCKFDQLPELTVELIQIVGCKAETDDCNGNPPPEFVLENDGLSATIRSSSDAGSGSTVRSVIGTLTNNQIDILTALISNPGSSGASLADVLDISSKTVNRNLKVLHGLGLVDRDGERNHVRWFATIDASDIDGSD